MLDWPGTMAATIFLGQCNFRCPFCHNAELVVAPDSLPDLDANDVIAFLLDRKDWVDHVVITGGEPTLARGLEGFLRQLKHHGFGVKLDTNGSRPSVLSALIDEKLIDFVAMDIKTAFDDYPRVVKAPVDIAAIRESARLLIESDVPYEFRMTVVPGLLTPQTIEEAARELARMGARQLVLQHFKPAETLDASFASVNPLSAREAEEIRMVVSRHLDTFWRGA